MKVLCSDGFKGYLYLDIKMNGEVKIGIILVLVGFGFCILRWW